MDIDDPVGIGPDQLRGDRQKAAREHNELRAALRDPLLKRAVERRAVRIALRLQNFGRDAGLCRALQSLYARIVADHGDDLRIGDGPVRDRVDDGLQIGASPGDQDCQLHWFHPPHLLR